MQWKEVNFNNALSQGMAGVSAVLIFGPDAGQVDELADKVIEKLAIDSSNLLVVDSNELKDKTDTVFAEACSPSLLGGRRLVWIHNAGDSDAPLVRELVTHKSLDAFVIISAGELRGGGSLRKLFDDGAKLASIVCYTDTNDGLKRLIEKELTAPKIGIKKIDPDAMQYMCGRLGGDRGITRRFLEKLALYVNDTKAVTLPDVEKCLPDNGEISLDEFMYSLTAGHIAATQVALDRVFFDGSNPVELVRMLDFHFKKLFNAVASGTYQKPFWKVAAKFETAIQIWPVDEIAMVLARLNELERQIKTTGMPGELILRDFALKLSVRAARLAIKRRGK